MGFGQCYNSELSWDLCHAAEKLSMWSRDLCIPSDRSACPLAAIVAPCGWACCATLTEDVVVKAEDIAALAVAAAADGRPLRLVWCVPPRLWDTFQAPAIDCAAVCQGQQQPRQGAAAAAARKVKVQYYALRLPAQEGEKHTGFAWGLGQPDVSRVVRHALPVGS